MIPVLGHDEIRSTAAQMEAEEELGRTQGKGNNNKSSSGIIGIQYIALMFTSSPVQLLLHRLKGHKGQNETKDESRLNKAEYDRRLENHYS